MYMLTTALVYNRNLVKPGEAPKTYQDLLDAKWKGRMMFDPEAAFIMAICMPLEAASFLISR